MSFVNLKWILNKLRATVILFIIANVIYAGDSLKKKPLYILEINYSANKMVNAVYSDRTKINNDLNQDDHQTYKVNFYNSINLNFQYHLNKNFCGKSQLYAGIGLNYTNGLLKHNLQTYSGPGHFSTYTSYTQNEFNYKFSMISLAPQINYMAFHKRFVFIHKLGISFSKYINNKSYSYNELYSGSHPDKDSSYITPSNPEGWYWVNTSFTSPQKTDVFPLKSNNIIFYNFSIGIIIKKIMPTFGCDLNIHFEKKGMYYFKTNFGLAYLF